MKPTKNSTRPSLITTYKPFIIPHLDYGDIICDKAHNTSFHENSEKIQYNRIHNRNFQRENFPRIRIKVSRKKTMVSKTLAFCKIFNKQSPIYLLNIIPVSSRSSFTRYVENVPFLKKILLL